jgi:hypothetical protein
MRVWLQENLQGLIVGFFAGVILVAALNGGYELLTAGFLVAALVLLTIMRQKHRKAPGNPK